MTATAEMETHEEGVLLAPVGPEGPWEALRALRAGVRGMAGGRCASATFVTAMTHEGHPADDSAEKAALLAVGIRWDA